VTTKKNAMTTIKDVEAQINTHEAVCAERYGNIENQFRSANARLKRIETILIGAAAGVVCAFGTIITMLFHLLTK
jgi:hypothetical protein